MPTLCDVKNVYLFHDAHSEWVDFEIVSFYCPLPCVFIEILKRIGKSAQLLLTSFGLHMYRKSKSNLSLSKVGPFYLLED